MPGPIRNDPTQVVAECQGDQRGRDQGGPDKQADAVKGSDDAGAEDFDHHDHGPRHEGDQIKEHPIKGAGQSTRFRRSKIVAIGHGTPSMPPWSKPGSCLNSPARICIGFRHEAPKTPR